MLLKLMLGITVGGGVYYAYAWFAARRSLQSMSYIDVRNAQIEEDLRVERKLSRRERLNVQLSALGYEGDITPLAVSVTLLYLFIAVVLSFFNASDLVSVVVAFPVALGATVAFLSSVRRRRNAKFTRQLLQALGTVAGHLEAGDIPQMAFQKAARMAENPLRAELEATLASRVGTESLSEAIADLGERYPSRAMTLLVASLRIDDQLGARLAPALRQAQATLERQFELAAEAKAEISQAKGEFYAMSVVILGIAGLMMMSSGGDSREAYTSPTGIIVMSVTIANYLLGVYRANRIFRKAASGQ